MKISIKIVGTSLQATNLETGVILFSEEASETWYREDRLKGGQVQLYDSEGIFSTIANYPVLFLGEVVDSGGNTFTEESFRDFVFNNLGSSTPNELETFITRILNLGGIIYSNPCA